MPRYFQWNIFNHPDLEKTCFDIDGVLCPDPTSSQNDDGEEYIEFIENTPPLYLPGQTIGCIVTSRLEKYRVPTQKWLAKHQIKYKELKMLNLPTKEARQKANNHITRVPLIYLKKRFKQLLTLLVRPGAALAASAHPGEARPQWPAQRVARSMSSRGAP